MRVRSGNRRWVVVIAIGVVLLVAAGIGAGRAEVSGLPLAGLERRLVGADMLTNMALRVDASGHDPHSVRLTLDGATVTGEVDGDTVVYRPGHLDDGEHAFVAEIPPGGPFGFLRTGPGTTATFTVDTAAPTVDVIQPDPVASYREPVTVRGTAPDAERVSIGARSVTPDPNGAFTIELPRAPVGAEVVAVDAAGNAAVRPLTVDVDLPRMRAVHVTAHAWSHDGLRESVLDLARQGRIDTVQLDIKDEDGVIGYDSRVPLAREAGAATAIYDARSAIRQLHDLGLRVVGRIVAFRDPTLATWAWHHGRPDWIVQNPSGQPYSSHYGAIAFTNFAHPAIREYNIAVAVEAAELGFDGVMYDYVRRPDGSLSSMRFPGLTTDPGVAVAEFLRQSRDPVHDAGAHLSAAVYGIASTRPHQIAQDIPLISRYVDFVAPMLYPSHWNSGEYGVPDPNRMPYEIILRSLRDFIACTENTDAEVVPWLQDFGLGVAYDDAQVRAQIDATRAAGIDGFFLWSPTVRYHAGALVPE